MLLVEHMYSAIFIIVALGPSSLLEQDSYLPRDENEVYRKAYFSWTDKSYEKSKKYKENSIKKIWLRWMREPLLSFEN